MALTLLQKTPADFEGTAIRFAGASTAGGSQTALDAKARRTALGVASIGAIIRILRHLSAVPSGILPGIPHIR